MSSWFGQAIKTFLNPELNATKVIEVKQDKYSDRVIYSREDSLILYHPSTKPSKGQPDLYEIALLRPYTESLSSAYSLYRSTTLEEAETKFLIFKDRIPLILSLSKDVCNVNSIQRICDALHENPSWSLAHIGVQLNLLDMLQNPEIRHHLNMPDPTNGLHPIHLAIKNSNLNAIKTLQNGDITLQALDHEGNTVYHYAAKTNKEIVMALSNNAPIYLNYRNASGHTPLHVACMADNRDCVKALLVAGADVNVPSHAVGSAASAPTFSGESSDVSIIVKNYDNKLHEEEMKNGGTPLHWASSREIIEDLILHKCDLNALNFNGRTALHVMAWRERLDCAIALLSHGCKVDVQDSDGNTPLHLAAKKKNIPLLQALVIFGADVNLKNNLKETARHIIATQSGEQAKKALYIVHAIGAQRCNDSSLTCSPCCDSNGFDSGIPPATPRCYPVRKILKAYKYAEPLKNIDGDRVLCLDGGGIRGLVLITILLHIEQTIGQPIVHSFDWIAGTSTGAILALGIASGKTLQECLCLYFQLKERIFVGSRPYPNETLEGLLKEIFGSCVMSDIKHPKLVITGLASDIKPADLHLFRNYTPPEELAFCNAERNSDSSCSPHPDELLVWKAARASGAAPSYFRMFEKYLDGGLIANNPSLDVLTEIHEYNLALKHANLHSQVKNVSVLVSIGTGSIPVTEVKDIDVFRPDNLLDGLKLVRGISALGTLLVDQATQSDGRVVERARAWCHSTGIRFYRFCPQLSEDITMDEKDDVKLIRMLWETKVYLLQHQDEVNELMQFLV